MYPIFKKTADQFLILISSIDSYISVDVSLHNTSIIWSTTNTLFIKSKTIIVIRSEKSRLPRTQQQDTLFTIKQWLYTLANNSAWY